MTRLKIVHIALNRLFSLPIALNRSFSLQIALKSLQIVSQQLYQNHDSLHTFTASETPRLKAAIFWASSRLQALTFYKKR